MKTLKQIEFVNGSANQNNLKAMQANEKKLLVDTIAKAQKSGLKNFAIIINYKGNIYGFKTAVANCLQRVKANKQGKKTVLKMFCPLAVAQVRQGISENMFTYYGTEKDLQAIREKHELKNNGQAVEYLINRKEHTTIDHTKSLVKGGDSLFKDTEIKYFVVGCGTSPSVRLIEKSI